MSRQEVAGLVAVPIRGSNGASQVPFSCAAIVSTIAVNALSMITVSLQRQEVKVFQLQKILNPDCPIQSYRTSCANLVGTFLIIQ